MAKINPKYLFQKRSEPSDYELSSRLLSRWHSLILFLAYVTDPPIYRFCEMMQVYGVSAKAVVHEKLGDGIMSAIDFSIDVESEEDPKGDRVKVIMCGKFLPYKKW